MATKEEVDAAILTIESSISSIDTFVLIFTALVAIGVVGEAYFGVSLWLKNRQLAPLRVEQSRIHESEIAGFAAQLAASNSQIAIARNAAAQAQLEQERIKALLAWRSINPSIIENCAVQLSKLGGTLTIAYIGLDPESLYYSLKFNQIFEESNRLSGSKNWIITPTPRVYTYKILFGLYISGQNQDKVGAVRACLASSGVVFSTEETPDEGMQLPGMAVGPTSAVTDVLIMVGSKPPPF